MVYCTGMEILVRWVISALTFMAATYLVPRTSVSGFGTAMVAALVLGACNLVVRPILLVLTLPVNILTLGLLTFAINALMVLLASWLVPGFHVGGFWWAMLFAVVLALVNAAVSALFGRP